MQIVFALGLDLLFEGPDVRPLTLAGIALVLAPTAWVTAGRERGTRSARTSRTSIPVPEHWRNSSGKKPACDARSGSRSP
jgi:hypothetical protein